MASVKGKNILITQSAMRVIAGSEIVALELAEELQSMGANVKIFTWEYGAPIRKFVEKKNIKVTCNEYDPFFKKCDYIWVHHQVLPELVLKELHSNKKYDPRIMFMHMSGIPGNYIEQPYIRDLELQLSDKNLYVSEEAKTLLEKMFYEGKEKIASDIFPNPFPEAFAEQRYNRSELKNVLVVSNHPPKEVERLKNMRSEINIVFAGNGGDKYELVTPKALLKYDAVITIGKTVQYCLACGVPVYVYDKSGGCGYLNKKNFTKNRLVNFSGRGNKKKTSEQIFSEIINGYDGARKYQESVRDEMIQEFSLANYIEKLFIDESKEKLLPEALYNTAMASMAMSKWKLKGDFYVKELVEVVKKRDNEIEAYKLKNDALKKIVNNYNNNILVRIYNKFKRNNNA